MYRLIEALPLANYRLKLRYANGVEGEVDLSHLVGQGVFAAWNDVECFNRVTLGDAGEPRWGNDIDLCPDALYLEISGP